MSQGQLNQVCLINQLQIEYKILEEENGVTYKGEVIKGTKIKHGYGEVTHKKYELFLINTPRYTYEGYWKESIESGPGAVKTKTKDGEILYDGEFHNGVR